MSVRDGTGASCEARPFGPAGFAVLTEQKESQSCRGIFVAIITGDVAVTVRRAHCDHEC
jgi:hypothetical protein